MTVMGNHEWFPKPSTDEEYTTIQNYWKNNVYYSSKVLKDKVMLIQMDNSRYEYASDGTCTVPAFTAEQYTKLHADLTEAKDKGYAVLLFVHVPIGNNLTPRTGDIENPFYSVDNTQWASGGVQWSNKMSIHSEDPNTKAVCQLIADYADIIEGVFAGHLHCDYYTTIYSNAERTGATIPQYVNGAAKFDTGNALKINLK